MRLPLELAYEASLWSLFMRMPIELLINSGNKDAYKNIYKSTYQATYRLCLWIRVTSSLCGRIFLGSGYNS